MLLKKKPKIAILTIRNTYNYGGVLATLKTVYAFCEQYFEPKVFFLGFDAEISTSLRSFKFSSSTHNFLYFGMNSVEIGARWAFWEPGHYRFTLSSWKKLLKDYDYFFVVSGTCIAAHPLVQLDKKFTMWIGTPYDEDRTERVKQLKNIRYLIDRFAQPRMNHIEQEIIKKSSFTWAISTYAQKSFQQMLGGPKDTLQLSGYPIDCSHAPSLALLRKKNIILAVGRFSDPRKNIDMVLRVFNQLHQQMPNLKLYVVGMKPANDKIFNYINLPAFANIVFTGQVTMEDLKALYAQAQLLLITSYQEGLGIVGLESLLYGTPVVATDCGGTRDYVIDGVTGYLVGINDDNAMTAKALSILQNQELRKKMALAGQQLIYKNFSIEKIYAQFQDGLSQTYPELKDWCKECRQKTVTTSGLPPGAFVQEGT